VSCPKPLTPPVKSNSVIQTPLNRDPEYQQIRQSSSNLPNTYSLFFTNKSWNKFSIPVI